MNPCIRILRHSKLTKCKLVRTSTHRWNSYFYCLVCFSYDVRSTENVGAHWADDKTLNGRANFHVTQQLAELVITNVSDKDEAVYKCRVDFKQSPTRNSRVNLSVICK